MHYFVKTVTFADVRKTKILIYIAKTNISIFGVSTTPPKCKYYIRKTEICKIQFFSICPFREFWTIHLDT